MKGKYFWSIRGFLILKTSIVEELKLQKRDEIRY